MSMYVNNSGQKKVKSIWVNNGGAKKVKQAWVNVNGIAKECFNSEVILLEGINRYIGPELSVDTSRYTDYSYGLQNKYVIQDCITYYNYGGFTKGPEGMPVSARCIIAWHIKTMTSKVGNINLTVRCKHVENGDWIGLCEYKNYADYSKIDKQYGIEFKTSHDDIKTYAINLSNYNITQDTHLCFYISGFGDPFSRAEYDIFKLWIE